MNAVGWVCTYTPEEIIRAAGFLPYRLLPYGENEHDGHPDIMPPTLCPYIRQVARNIHYNGGCSLHGAVIAGSCSAAVHLDNTLTGKGELFVHLLDVPRGQTAAAVRYFTAQLNDLALNLGRQGREITYARLREAVEYCRETEKLGCRSGDNKFIFQGKDLYRYFELLQEVSSGRRNEFNLKAEELLNRTGTGFTRPYLVLTGALPPRGLIELLSKSGWPCFLDNCLALRYISRSYSSHSDQASTREELMEAIAGSYLNKLPCPRINAPFRQEYYRRLLQSGEVKGVIYHELSFCDYSHYDRINLRGICASFDIPLLQINTELGRVDAGQLQTRIQAFTELLE